MRFILLIALLLSLQAKALFAQPILEVTPKEINLGTIYLGRSVPLKFEIRNRGNELLRILKIAPSCGCTAADMPKDSLFPGESLTISLIFDPSGFSGEVKKTVGIYTNSQEKFSQFQFSAKIATDLEYTGGGMSAWAGRIKKDEIKTIKIDMANRAGFPILVKSVTSSLPELTIVLPKSTGRILSTEPFTFEIRIRGTGEEFSQALLTIETDNPRQPLVPLRVTFVGE